MNRNHYKVQFLNNPMLKNEIEKNINYKKIKKQPDSTRVNLSNLWLRVKIPRLPIEKKIKTNFKTQFLIKSIFNNKFDKKIF